MGRLKAFDETRALDAEIGKVVGGCLDELRAFFRCNIEAVARPALALLEGKR